MKITMIVHLAGADFSLAPGDDTDRFADDEAMRLISNGFAVPFAGPEGGEVAVKPAPAETRPARGKGKKRA